VIGLKRWASGALASIALMVAGVAPQPAQAALNVYATIADVKCTTDAVCQLIGYIQVQSVATNGVTGAISYSWSPTCVGSPDFTPSGTHTGCFVQNPISGGATSGANSNITSLLGLAASATGGAKFALPEGVAPSAPNNGDVWMDATGLNMRVEGVTYGPVNTIVTTIAALQALTNHNVGEVVFVVDLQGGGDPFKYYSGSPDSKCPNSTADGGICFTAGGSGYWVRQRPAKFVAFTDYGGNPAGTTNLAAAQLTLTACGYGWPILFAPGDWVMGGSVNLAVPTSCNDFSNGVSLDQNIGVAAPALSATLDFGTNTFATAGQAYVSRLGASMSTYNAGGHFGGFNIIGNPSNGTPGVIGFYDAQVKDDSIHDISVIAVNGPAFKFGFSYLIHTDRLRAVNSGASGYCDFEIDGASGNTTTSTATTFYASYLDLEPSVLSNKPDCGIKVDRLVGWEVKDSVIEAGAPFFEIGTKSNSTFFVSSGNVHDSDMEGATGATAIILGTGWGGATASGIIGQVFQNNSIVSSDATKLFSINNSRGFQAVNNTNYSNGTTPVVFSFDSANGTNLDAFIPANLKSAANIVACCTYINLVSASTHSPSTQATPYADWHSSGVGDSYAGSFTGTASNTSLYCGADAPVQIVTSTLVRNSALTPTTGATCRNGAQFKIRNEATLGAFALTYGATSGATALPLHSTASVLFDGTSWYGSQSAP
jgi:hypothetical protein